ncbi:MAG TPA: GNAT family N-acetyltransferase [Casimicrobiaceae bacterium]|nr:GNAT family N-acetyltransferase [Casimicrobiaceae bacterium]
MEAPPATHDPPASRAPIWRRALDPFVAFGWRAGALYALDRVLRRLSPRVGLQVYELVEQPVTERPLLAGKAADRTTFAEIRRGDPAIALMPARDDIKEERFAQGARCLGAYRNGALVGYIWFCFGRYREDEVRCDYELAEPLRAVFDFDLYIMPEHRMGTAFVAVWHGANRYLSERGIRHTFSRVTRFNVASRRAHARLGAACVARAVFVQAWRVEMMMATLPPYVAVTWSPKQRVRLVLRSRRTTAPEHEVR